MPENRLNLAILNLPDRSQHLAVMHCGNLDMVLTTKPIALPINHQDTHEHYEFLVPLSSIPHFYVDSREINCRPGVLVPINPGQRHGLKRARNAISFISVFFPCDWMDRLIRKVKSNTSLGFPNEPLVLEQDVQLLISQLVGENRRNAPCREYLLHNLTEQLAILLIRHYYVASRPPETILPDQLTGEQLRFKAIIETIHKEYCLPLTVARLAEMVRMNNYHFIRCFKRAFSVSPYHFIMRVRMAQAKQLLRTTGLPIAQVSLQCGFNSASRFSSLFYQENGMTPGSFRKSAQAASRQKTRQRQKPGG